MQETEEQLELLNWLLSLQWGDDGVWPEQLILPGLEVKANKQINGIQFNSDGGRFLYITAQIISLISGHLTLQFWW